MVINQDLKLSFLGEDGVVVVAINDPDGHLTGGGPSGVALVLSLAYQRLQVKMENICVKKIPFL